MTKILCFDPSGNFSDREGKGETGLSLFVDGKIAEFGSIRAQFFPKIEMYWDDHADTIEIYRPNVIVCESYKLQPGKAMQQSWSAMETSQMIGYLRMVAWKEDIPFIFQDPAIKPRFSDEWLVSVGIAEERPSGLFINGQQTNKHIRDSIRHGLYYLRYGKDGNK